MAKNFFRSLEAVWSNVEACHDALCKSGELIWTNSGVEIFR